MCDYSLGGIRNRLAVEGEDLVVHRFPTHSIGLASPADLRPKVSAVPICEQTFAQRVRNFFLRAFESPNAPAVCIPPGARLTIKRIPLDLQCKWNVGEDEDVVFTQTSADANTYRDAVAFRNGCQVSMQHLTEGMPVKVISLGGSRVEEREPAFAAGR
jgi:hypothetical protein